MWLESKRLERLSAQLTIKIKHDAPRDPSCDYGPCRRTQLGPIRNFFRCGPPVLKWLPAWDDGFLISTARYDRPAQLDRFSWARRPRSFRTCTHMCHAICKTGGVAEQVWCRFKRAVLSRVHRADSRATFASSSRLQVRETIASVRCTPAHHRGCLPASRPTHDRRLPACARAQ